VVSLSRCGSYNDPQNSVKEQAYNVVNGSIGLRALDEKWTVRIGFRYN